MSGPAWAFQHKKMKFRIIWMTSWGIWCKTRMKPTYYRRIECNQTVAFNALCLGISVLRWWIMWKKQRCQCVHPALRFLLGTNSKEKVTLAVYVGQSLLYDRHSRDSVDIASNNDTVNWAFFKFHVWSWAADTKKGKEIVKLSIPGTLSKGGKFVQ